MRVYWRGGEIRRGFVGGSGGLRFLTYPGLRRWWGGSGGSFCSIGDWAICDKNGSVSWHKHVDRRSTISTSLKDTQMTPLECSLNSS